VPLTERLQARVQNYASLHGIEKAIAPVHMAKELGVARFGDPEEIARMVAVLASPVAGYCQGSILDIDGGQTRTL
jgi:3-oxoacyl-[acyl-carrier protein] reductase